MSFPARLLQSFHSSTSVGDNMRWMITCCTCCTGHVHHWQCIYKQPSASSISCSEDMHMLQYRTTSIRW
jgi:hypothetical protein